MDERLKFIFLDTEKNEELLLPVTPSGYEIDHGINSEKVNLTELGTTNIPGKRYMMNISISCMFPAKKYGFLNEGAKTDPYFYVKKFEGWCDSGKILRFFISRTNINTTCFIESIKFKEQDGTGDVYASINVAQCRVIEEVNTSVKSETGNNARNETESKKEETLYTIKKGDTLSGICRQAYGDSSLYGKLAQYNGIKNANIIYIGNTIKIPDKSIL